ncbi:MAG: DUF5615 family PIN-like protein [Opitutales bacterium]|nr:DUF5615 family PIN-like protein [Opitutales bacterium]
MTLVFDENLSPRLTDRLSELFGSATHVEKLGLKGEDDVAIWKRAKHIEKAVLVTKDDDFRELALAFGPPPKVLMLCVGNCSTKFIETLLCKRKEEIEEFVKNAEASLLELSV